MHGQVWLFQFAWNVPGPAAVVPGPVTGIMLNDLEPGGTFQAHDNSKPLPASW